MSQRDVADVGWRRRSLGLAALSAGFGFALPTLFSYGHHVGWGERANIIAIDVALQADAAMLDHARAVHARLRNDDPHAEALDTSRARQITLVQTQVDAGDVEAVRSALARAVQDGPALPMRLTVTGLAVSEAPDRYMLAYVIERSPEFVQLVHRIADAVRPFSVAGPATGLPVTSIEEPRVWLGSATPVSARALLAEPFEKFRIVGVKLAVATSSPTPRPTAPARSRPSCEASACCP